MYCSKICDIHRNVQKSVEFLLSIRTSYSQSSYICSKEVLLLWLPSAKYDDADLYWQPFQKRVAKNILLACLS